MKHHARAGAKGAARRWSDPPRPPGMSDDAFSHVLARRHFGQSQAGRKGIYKQGYTPTPVMCSICEEPVYYWPIHAGESDPLAEAGEELELHLSERHNLTLDRKRGRT